MDGTWVPDVDRLVGEADLGVVAEATSSAPSEREGPRRLLAEHEEARSRVLGADALFHRLTAPDDKLAPVSPRLFFEVLLRRTVRDLGGRSHTVERSGTRRLPVFDVDRVIEFVAVPAVLHYLAQMLASFTRVESRTERVWIRRGIVRKVRYSDMDVRSLMRLARRTDEEHRFPLYKLAADLCLLVLGIFPDRAATATRYPGTGALRAQDARRTRHTTEEYETLAAQMYGLGAAHPAAAASGQSKPLRAVGNGITEVKKPLIHLAEHYLGFRRERLFG